MIKPQDLNLISFFASKGNFRVNVDSHYIERMNKEPIQWGLLAKNTDIVKSKLYMTAFLTAISHGELTEDEFAILEEYREETNISPTDAEKIHGEVISEISQKDNRVSEDN